MRAGPVENSNATADVKTVNVLTAGKPVRLYAASITSDGTAGVLQFRDGTLVTDTLICEATGTINKTVLVADIPAEGILFPNGLTLVMDAHVTACVAWAEQSSKN
jgi:hypothetical protein